MKQFVWHSSKAFSQMIRNAAVGSAAVIAAMMI
jgi:hypothetical protein